jgi:hypothetical protein
MKDVLMILGFFILVVAIFVVPLMLVIKYQAYKAKKYYRLLAVDFNLELSNDKSNFFGVEGINNECKIIVCNHSFKSRINVGKSTSSKQMGVKISVHHPKLNTKNSSITSLKKVKNKKEVEITNFNNYFNIKIPTEQKLSNEIKQQVFETAYLLGFEDNLDIQQEKDGAFIQIHSFPLVNKKRYLKCKAIITLLINLNNYLTEKQFVIPKSPIN